MVPGEQAAVMLQGLLHVDAPLLLRGCNPAVVVPPQLHRLIQVGRSTLQRQPVTMENQLSLWGDELEEGQLQRSVWGRIKKGGGYEEDQKQFSLESTNIFNTPVQSTQNSTAHYNKAYCVFKSHQISQKMLLKCAK